MPSCRIGAWWVLAGALGLAACDRSHLYAEKKKVKYEGPVVVFDSVNTLYSDNAVPRVKIIAPRQVVAQNGDVRYPAGMKITQYNERGVPTTTLRGDSGRYDKVKQFYEAFGNIEVHNIEQQQTLYTTQLAWDQPKREIRTDKPIKIITPNERLEGVGLVSDEQFNRYRITKPTGIFPAGQ
jgi:LPS export ABC transporter protein LptC